MFVFVLTVFLVHYAVHCLSPISRVPHMFPNYIRAPNGAEAKPVSQLYDGKCIVFTERQKQQQTILILLMMKKTG